MEDNIERIRGLVKAYTDNIIESLCEFVKIPSVKPDKPINGDPLGPEIHRALEYVGELAEELGFTFRNIDDKAGVIEYGDGQETLGILLHLDVVPAGDNWKYPPFGGEIHDGYIWGRGTIDDKGPAISVIYALKAIADSGIKLNKKIRIIFGTDEESGEWSGIKHYLKKEGAPDMSFVPDSEFPIINGEKGFANIIISSKNNHRKHDELYDLIDLHGGIRPNMVADYAVAVLKLNDGDSNREYSKLQNLVSVFNRAHNSDLNIYRYEDYISSNPDTDIVAGDFVIDARGKSAHGSNPEEGHNALSDINAFLSELPVSSSNLFYLSDFLNKYVGYETDGKSLGIYTKHDFLGETTVCLGKLTYLADNDRAQAILNIRFPFGISKDEIPSRINEIINKYNRITGARLYAEADPANLDPLYVSPDTPFIKGLANAYETVTGTKCEFKAIGGTTYAKAVPNAVSFGPLMPGEPELAHQPNERVSIDSLVRNAEIYAVAIYNIAATDYLEK